MERIIIFMLLISPAVAELIFLDEFEYDVGRNDTNAVETFQANGWSYAKTEQDSDRDPGGYIYTTETIPGYTGVFPGQDSSKALVLESLPSTLEIMMGYLQQTDFYLQWGAESGSVGQVPPDVWFQFWLYNNDFGNQSSVFARGNKWIYPTRESYPCTGEMCRWLVSIGSVDQETDGSPPLDLNDGPDVFISNRPPLAVFAGASEVPTNQDKLGSNLAPNTYIEANTWTLVKLHIDTSGEQGTYEMWLKKYGEDWIKTAEWIGDVTPQFTWPIPEHLRDGHKMFRMPTTMNIRHDHGFGGDTWSYLDDFAIATLESDLPVYGPPVTSVSVDCDFNAPPSSEHEGGTYTCNSGSATLFFASNLNGPVFEHTNEGWQGSGAAKFYTHTSGTNSYRQLNFHGIDAPTQQNMRYLIKVETAGADELGGKWHLSDGIDGWRTWMSPVSRAGNLAGTQPEIAYHNTVWMAHGDGASASDCSSSGYQCCQHQSTWWSTTVSSCTQVENDVFYYADYEDEWVTIEIERHRTGEYKIYIWTQDGVFNGLYYWLDTTFEEDLGRAPLGAYLEGAGLTGKYFIVDEVVVSDTMIGPPAGFGSCNPVHAADTCDGIIDLNELINHLDAWRNGQFSIQSVMGAIRIWKG